MFIVSLHYVRPLEEVDRHLEAHVAYLKQQYAQGHFLASGRKVPRTGGVILARVGSREALQAVLEQDPFHQNQVAEYEVIEFVPGMVAEGLESIRE